MLPPGGVISTPFSIPFQSLIHSTETGTLQRQRFLYVRELERQASLATASLARAWLRASDPATAIDDAAVWGELQAALFASVVISRILKPTSVRARPGRSKRLAQAQATTRGRDLRQLLGVTDDSILLAVATIRDPLEHFDERLDAVIEQGWASTTDFWICHGLMAGEVPEHDGSVRERNRTLRTYLPAAGLMLFGVDQLDLYELDIELLELLHQRIPTARREIEEKTPPGLTHFGASQPNFWPPADKVTARRSRWLGLRSELGAPIQDPPELLLALPPAGD